MALIKGFRGRLTGGLWIELKFGVNGAWLKKGTGEKYVSEKFPHTKKEAELLQAFREMSPEDKKMLLSLIDKTRKASHE